MKSKNINFVLFHSFEREWFVNNPNSFKTLNTHIIKLINNYNKYSKTNYRINFYFLTINENRNLVHQKKINLKLFHVNLFKRIIPLEFSFSLLNFILKSKKKKIWHLNTYYYLMFDFTVILLKLKRQKVIAHHRGGGVTLKSFIYTFPQYYIILPILLRFVDKIIVQNTWELKRLVKWNLISKNKIEYIPNGIDTTEFKLSSKLRLDKRKELNFSKDDIVLAFVGRFEFLKGLNDLITIFSNINNKSNLNIKLLMIGDGPDKNSFIEKLSEKNLLDLVIFTKSYVTHDELIKYYNCSDLLLHLNTNSEGSPNVILEAQSCGLPVIGFNIPGVQDSINDGISGHIIENKNFKDYEQKLLNLINDKYRLLNMRVGAREFIKENFEIKKIIKKYEQVYGDL